MDQDKNAQVQSETSQANCLLKTDIKPEYCIINGKTFGKYNISIDKLLELKAQNPGWGYRKLGAELNVNYKVIQRLSNYLKYNPDYQKNSAANVAPAKNTKKELRQKPAENLELEVKELYKPSYKDHTLGKNFNSGQLIVSGYLKEK